MLWNIISAAAQGRSKTTAFEKALNGQNFSASIESVSAGQI